MLMVPDHGTQYKENLFTHHAGMHKESIDRQTDGVDPFLYSLTVLRQSGE